MGEITKSDLFGLGDYVPSFYDNNAEVSNPNRARIASSYYRHLDDETYYKFRTLEEKDTAIDTALEWALASYYSPAVVQIRPPEAAAILPENNRESPLKLAAAVLYKLAEVKFLTPQDTAAIGRYEGMVKFIQDKHGLTRAEIDKYYRDAVYAEAMKIINVEFNEVSFMMDRTYNTTLSLNPQSGKYTLSYFRPTRKDDVKVISDLALEALLSEMGKAGLNQTCTNEVRKQAGLLPAVKYAELKKQGNADALELIAETLTNFYVNPSADNYRAIAGIYVRIYINGGADLGSFHQLASDAYQIILKRIYEPLYDKLRADLRTTIDASWSNYPNDKRFEVFNK